MSSGEMDPARSAAVDTVVVTLEARVAALRQRRGLDEQWAQLLVEAVAGVDDGQDQVVAELDRALAEMVLAAAQAKRALLGREPAWANITAAQVAAELRVAGDALATAEMTNAILAEQAARGPAISDQGQ